MKSGLKIGQIAKYNRQKKLITKNTNMQIKINLFEQIQINITQNIAKVYLKVIDVQHIQEAILID